ncbi:hypothetical protein RB653_010140 [Dictyostelium firmibasis]|uniref:Uncharacterized protein n=1 Tax=Dictyostelium firmibasis TaxID=79012 RepID=A0AAN7TRU2_9MYCE
MEFELEDINAEQQQSSTNSNNNNNKYSIENKMGIPISKLIVDKENISKKYFCTICSDLLVNSFHYDKFKAVQCKNGHYTNCLNCWEKHLEKKKNCIQCGVDVESIESLSSNLLVTQKFTTFKIHCPNSFFDTIKYIKDEANGCKDIIQIDELEAHLKLCPYDFISCKNCEEFSRSTSKTYVQCQDYRKNTQEKHNLICPYVKVSCEYCGETINKINLESHYLNWCQEVDIKCQDCQLPFKKKEIEQHQKSFCPESIIECRYSKGGCNAMIRRSKLAQHLTEGDNHHQFISNILNQQDLKINELELKNTEFSLFTNGQNKKIIELENLFKELQETILNQQKQQQQQQQQQPQQIQQYNHHHHNNNQHNNSNSGSYFANSNNINNLTNSDSAMNDTYPVGGPSAVYKNKWIISNYTEQETFNKSKEYIKSPLFKIGNSTFFLKWFPSGKKKLNYCSIFLYKIQDDKSVIINYYIHLVNHQSSDEVFEKKGCQKYDIENGSAGYGSSQFIKRSELLNDANGFLVDGAIVIEIEIIATEEILPLQSNIN